MGDRSDHNDEGRGSDGAEARKLPKRAVFIIICAALWLILFVGSIFLSWKLDGPRNLDTALAQLSIFFIYQALALFVAIVSLIFALLWRKEIKMIVMVGLAPIVLTLLAICAIWVAVMLIQSPTPTPVELPPKQATQPAPG